MKNHKCDKYEIAITDYVLGEEMDITKQELLEHLRSCEKCLKDLSNWQNIYGTLRTEAYHNRPEVKAKWEAFIKEVTSKPLAEIKKIAGEKAVNTDVVVGGAAGAIWRVVAYNGKIAMLNLKQETKLPDKTFERAIGWLLREDKVQITEAQQTEFITLSDKEREQKQAGV